MNNERKQKSERDQLITIVTIFAAIFLLLFTVVNFDTFSGYLSSIISVLNPVIIGFIIAYICNPIYKWLFSKALSKVKRVKLKKTLSLILTYVIVLGVVTGLLLIIVPQVMDAINDFASKIEGYIKTAVSWVNNIIRSSGLFESEDGNAFELIDQNEIIKKLTEFIENSGSILQKVSNIIIDYGGDLVVGITDVFLGLFISIYVLIFKSNIARWLKRLLRTLMSRERYDQFIHRTNHANGKFGNYLIGALTDSIIVAVEGLIIFSLFGIPYAPLVAVIVGITNIIPILGPFLGAIPSAFIIFIVDPGKVLLFVILIIVIQQIDGNIVAPLILGSSLGLNSLGIIIAITVMGGLWGIPGMFIGVPLFAFIADMIDESVNARLREIDDPEFLPDDKTEEKISNGSPVFSFIKKYFAKGIKAIKSAAQSAIKNNNSKKK